MFVVLIFSLTILVRLSKSATKRWKLTKMMSTLCATERKHTYWMKCMMKVRKCHFFNLYFSCSFHHWFSFISLCCRYNRFWFALWSLWTFFFLLACLLLDQSKASCFGRRGRQSSSYTCGWHVLLVWMARATCVNGTCSCIILIGRKFWKLNKEKTWTEKRSPR